MLQFVVVLNNVGSEIYENLIEETRSVESAETSFTNTNLHYRRDDFLNSTLVHHKNSMARKISNNRIKEMKNQNTKYNIKILLMVYPLTSK